MTSARDHARPLHLGRRLATVLAVLMAVLGTVTSAEGPRPAAASAEADTPTGVLPAGGRWSVTLLTGEVIDVRADGDGRVSASLRSGADGPVQTVRLPDGELYVFPLAVTSLVDRVLDRELFNVTGLIRQGYDDAGTDSTPLIVQGAPSAASRSSLAAAGEQPLPSIGAVATEVPKGDTAAADALLASLAQSPGAGLRAASTGPTHVWLDRRMTTASAPSPSRAAAQASPGNLAQVGADRAQAAGFTGSGVTVAVLDTGIDATHPDLAGRVVAQENFSVSPDTVDRVGHGTHVASIVAGERSGVAPGTSLLVGKVLDDTGFGNESDVIAGMEWAAPQADVVNMSLGAPFSSDGSDPLSLAVDALSDQFQTLFVIAAGNSGPVSASVEIPGTSDRALTVGAVDGSDAVADFSSRGPMTGSFALKPEVVAPGVDIVAARAAGTSLGDPVDGLFTSVSGTSMATPHVAGAAADLVQQHPDWTAAQLKDALVGSADPIEGDGFDVGAGRLDIGDALDATVRPERDVADVVLADPRTAPHAETFSWTNTGSEPETLDLSVSLEDRHGSPVDAVSVSPASLALAPGATGSATVTIDGPALGAGLYTGTVTADPEGPAGEPDDVRTPIGLHATPPTVNLTLEATPPRGSGATDAQALVAIANLDDFAEFGQLWFFSGSLTLAVPAGRYSVLGEVGPLSPFGDEDPTADVVALVGEPDVTLAEDTTILLDGAAAVPLRPAVEHRDTAPPMFSSVDVVTTPKAGTGGFGVGLGAFSFYPAPAVQVTPLEADADVFSTSTTFRLQTQPFTARVGGETLPLTTAQGGQEPPEGDLALTAFDAGDGSDLAGSAGRLAVVTLPLTRSERAAVTQRAVDAGAAAVAFVAPDRAYATLNAVFPFRWADIATVIATGPAAARLQAAASAGEPVTVTATASPFVYDIVTPVAHTLDPAPVITRADQHDLATLHEHFHRDPDGSGGTGDRRYPISESLMNLDSVGPLPLRRTAFVTAGVTWESIVFGPGFFGNGGEEPIFAKSIALSMDEGRAYSAGSPTRLDWLSRPLYPGPVGTPFGGSFCQPTPVLRTPGTLQVWLSPFQDGPDRFGCTSPSPSTLVLERDGVEIGRAIDPFAEFTVPPEPATYRIAYEQRGQSPYLHHSTTAWTFRSAAPSDPTVSQERIPLLVVDYGLPLDDLNRPTGRVATFTVHQVTGTTSRPVTSFQVDTSTDGGTTWRPATVQPHGGGRYRVTLPRASAGTAVSLRVDATDRDGNRIEQTLFDAYTA